RSLAAGPDRVATVPAEAALVAHVVVSCGMQVQLPSSQRSEAPCIPGARFALAATGILPCGNWTCLSTQLLGPATCSKAVAAGHRVRLGCIMRPPGQWDRPARRQTSDDIVCTTTARGRHAAAAAPGQCNSGTRRRERTTLVPRLSTGWGAC